MGFVRRLGTTGKVPIPDSSKKSSKDPICMALSKKIEDNDIPPSRVLNLDQMLSKYIPVLNKTMSPKGSKTVPIKGSTEKKDDNSNFHENSRWSLLTNATYLWRKNLKKSSES